MNITRTSVSIAFVSLALALAVACEGSSSDGGPPSDDQDLGFEPTDAVGDVDIVPDPGPDSDVPDVEDADVPPEVEIDIIPPWDVDAEEVDAADADVDVAPEEVDDDICIPDCADKECGPDGCGGLCGYCVHPEACNGEGQCKVVCELQCEGKECGPDGCGGFCGSCEDLGDDLACGEDNLCYPDCELASNECGTRVCGFDKCGNSCGQCAPPKLCSANQAACVYGPCGTITHRGECQGDTLVRCDNADSLEDQELVEEDCTEQEDFGCAWDPVASEYTCMDTGPCEPSCLEGAECGADGCGGECGAGCASGWNCLGGSCTPEPGADCGGHITSAGRCDGDDLWFCSHGKVNRIECDTFDETCGWVQAKNKFDCK